MGERRLENRQALGGMRAPRRAAKRVPGLKETGKKVDKILGGFIAQRPEIIAQSCNAIGVKEAKGPSQVLIDKLTKRLEDVLGDSDRVLRYEPGAQTEVNAELIERWRHRSGDPDAEAVDWLTAGAPAGIDLHPQLAGIFPSSEGKPKAHRPIQPFDPAFTNYSSVEDDEAAVPEVTKLMDTPYVDVYATLKEVKDVLGEEPVLSKLAMLSKEQLDTIKKRLILNCLASGVNSKTKQFERLLLPFITDVINDSLDLLGRLKDDEEVWFMVLDYTDAFFKVPCARASASIPRPSS